MKWLDRLERRFGAYAVPNLTLWLLAGQAMVFLGQFIGPKARIGGGAAEIIGSIALDPQKVYAGEWWRLLTFPFIAPVGGLPIFAIFYFLIFFYLGTTLENAWGSFRYNAYLGIGYVATVAAAFLADAISPGAGWVVGDYVYWSLFLAFARLQPDFEIRLFFVLPVKMRYLAWFVWAGYALPVIFGPWNARMMAIAAVANYLVFFGFEIVGQAKQGRRRMKQQAKRLKPAERVAHECRVCGITSGMAPKMAFRYCSKCAGQQCYCPDHLKNHEHVVESDASDQPRRGGSA